MMQLPGFVNMFEQVGIRPLDAQLVPEVVRQVARDAQAGEPLDESALRGLLQLTTRFWPQRPQPGPALELFRRVHHYRAEKKAIGEDSTLDEAFVEKVFSI